MARHTQPGLADWTFIASNSWRQRNQLSHSDNDYSLCDWGCFGGWNFKPRFLAQIRSFCLATNEAVTFGATGWSVSVARRLCMAPNYVTQLNQPSHSDIDYKVCDCGYFFKESKICSFCLSYTSSSRVWRYRLIRFCGSKRSGSTKVNLAWRDGFFLSR